MVSSIIESVHSFGVLCFSGMQDEFDINEKTLWSLSAEIQRLHAVLNGYVEDILSVAQCHRKCSGGGICT